MYDWCIRYNKGCNICDWVPPGYPNQPCSRGKDGKDGPLPLPDDTGIPAAVAAAKAADVAVLFLGADQTTEAENFDRRGLGLVGAQEALLAAVVAVQPNTVVVLVHGGPIAVETAAASPAVRAIVDAFQPGELGMDAVLDVLEGVTSPSGLMPYTSYLKNFTSRDIREVDLRAGRGLTYWWHTDPVLYPFGWGMHYTNFSFVWSNLPPADAALSSIQVPLLAVTPMLQDFAINHTVTVTNTGGRVSDVVALAFVVAVPGSSHPDTPIRKLFGFERLAGMKPGESRTVFFASTADSLGVVRCLS